MTSDELAELIGLSIDEDLPESLRTAVERAVASDPKAAWDASTLRETVDRLRSLPGENADEWFVERSLQGLLRDHDREHEHDRWLKSA